jgi:hypothetical protein
LEVQVEEKKRGMEIRIRITRQAESAIGREQEMGGLQVDNFASARSVANL